MKAFGQRIAAGQMLRTPVLYGAAQIAAVVWLAVMGQVVSAASGSGASVYTCVDDNGRRITSDRYIASCSHREQRELSPTGALRRIIPPALTRQQQQEQEARLRAEQAAQAQARARARALNTLLQRYPTPQAHSQVREQELAVVAKRIEAGNQQLALLRQEKIKADAEMAFYQKNPEKAPAALRAQVQAITESERATVRYVANQQEMLKAVHARFDAEAAELTPMWNKR